MNKQQQKQMEALHTLGLTQRDWVLISAALDAKIEAFRALKTKPGQVTADAYEEARDRVGKASAWMFTDEYEAMLTQMVTVGLVEGE